MNVTVRIARNTRGWYRAWCPALPGCMVHGRSHQEAAANLSRAIHAYVVNLNVVLPRELERKFLAEGRLAS
jgi:predicted RNase H-like HicB family nuclease